MRPLTKTSVLTFQHTSMKFSDTPAEISSDANKIFNRGKDICTGTEAGGGGNVRRVLAEVAPDYGYHLWNPRGQDAWVAVHKSLYRPGYWEADFVPVLTSKQGIGHHGNRGIAWASFKVPHLGLVTVGSAHLLTHGRSPKDPNWDENVRFTKEIGQWGKAKGAGRGLVFYAGDQNIVDKTNDTFIGQPFTSAWDELKRYEGTGHGNIDVIASYDMDGRVSAKYIRALDDRELRLNTDHFLVEAGFEVRWIR